MENKLKQESRQNRNNGIEKITSKIKESSGISYIHQESNERKPFQTAAESMLC